MGFDAIGFHAIGELITSALPPVTYNLVSIPSGSFTSNYFQRGVATSTTQPTVTTSTVLDILWDDDTTILWDDDTEILWDI